MNIHTFPILQDSIRGGDLIPIEFSNIPFIPKRIFIIKNVPQGHTRGGHAHKLCKQFYICISGKIEIEIKQTNQSNNVVCLERGQSLFVDTFVWTKEIFAEEDSILLVVASHSYDSNDYLTFEEMIGNKNG
ncbi:MAG: FdtA/QdtA family cupin domain-containing protein [Methanogenium sp.]|jgi:hypothetical protein